MADTDRTRPVPKAVPKHPGIFRVRNRAGKWTYSYVIDVGRKPDGKRDQRRRSGFRTLEAAEAARTEALAKVASGEHADAGRETVGAFLDRWLAAKGPSWEPVTLQGHRSAVNARIKPRLGDKLLGKLTPLDCQTFYAQLQERYAPRTVRLTHAVLHGALDQAVRWRLLHRNPADRPALPATPKQTAKAWTAEQARAILAAIGDPDEAALVRLAFDSGMRIAEILGLTWADVDPAAGTVAVRRRLIVLIRRGREVREGAKRKGSLRTIHVAPDTVAALRGVKDRQAFRGVATGLVFCGDDGRPLSPQTVRERFARAVARTGAPPYTFHSTRHTMATLALAAGVPVKVVSDRLGHASVAITLDLYAHVLPTMRDQAAEAMARLLGESA